MNDLRFAFRMLLKSPGFTAVAVLTLALGIGANSAIFSVVDTVLLRALPFPHPDQLVTIWGTSARGANARELASVPDMFDFRAQSRSFSAVAAYSGAWTVLTGVSEAQELDGVAVDGDFFEALGVAPMLGRGFTAEEAKLGAPNVVVISYNLWKRAFASDPNIVGRQVTMRAGIFTVVGVMPTGWKFPVNFETSDFVMPLKMLFYPNAPSQRSAHVARMMGRLKPGGTVAQADAELKTIARQLEQQYPETNADRGAAVMPMLQDIVRNVRPGLLVLLGAVALVLLIACANVANLLLARAAARAREIGIRAALGASRAEIVRQLLIESLLLALLGAAGGLLLAWWSIHLLGAFGPSNIPRLSEVHLNFVVGAFTFALAILSTLLFGLVPALQISRGNLTDALQQGAKGSTGGLHGTRVRAFLVVSQVSLSLLLLSGAGLLIRTFFNLQATNVGFDPTRLLVINEALPRATYSEEQKQRAFYLQILPKLAALPGFESVAGVNPAPFSGEGYPSSFWMEFAPDPGPGHRPEASRVLATPGYFRTIRIPLRAGRDFEPRDNENAPHVAIVNETFARRLIPDRDPIGQHIFLDRENGGPDSLEIVGVVGDAKQTQLGAPTAPEMYQPFAQSPSRQLWLVFRTATENLSGAHAAVRGVFREQDPDVFVSRMDPMESLIGETLVRPKFNMLLLGAFAGTALLLAAIGIYGVIAYSVTQRTREIGIRMALGAQRRDMLGMVLRQSLTVVVIGIAIGLMAAFASTRLLASLLYGVGANDVLTYASVVFLLGTAALLASYIPARRAMKVDPMIALRYE
jgi:putative ABC transport system permease protein